MQTTMLTVLKPNARDLTMMRSLADELMTVSEVAAFLKVPISWVYERTRRKGAERLPHVKLGKYLRFSMSEIKEWLQKQNREF
jgi:excisionase family DNA binding protein